jgi:hypothetical protein
VALVEVGECIYDSEQLERSHGYEGLDPVAREAFINHIHFGIKDLHAAEQIVESWIAEMRTRWPKQVFRIYRHTDVNEVVIRFHVVRAGLPNWCEEGIEVLVVSERET